MSIEIIEPNLQIARGKVPGVRGIRALGRNPDVDTATVPENIWDAGGIYTPPTTNRIHNVVSTDVNDVGTVLSAGTIDTHNGTDISDLSATFQTDTVSVGDLIVFDTIGVISAITAIPTESTLTIDPLFSPSISVADSAYRVVTPGSTGAALLQISGGQTTTTELINEFIVLNGTTNVPTVRAYYRMTRMFLHSAGVTGDAEGTITLTAVTDATVTAQINPGAGTSRNAFYRVPLGKTAYLVSWYGSVFRTGVASDAMALLAFKSRLFPSASSVPIDQLDMTISVGSMDTPHSFKPYIPIPQGVDIWIECVDVSDNNSQIGAGFELHLVDN